MDLVDDIFFPRFIDVKTKERKFHQYFECIGDNLNKFHNMAT